MQITQALPTHPKAAHAVVVGGGTMGADVAVVLARGGARVTVLEPNAAQAAKLSPRIATELAASGFAGQETAVTVAPSLDAVNWPDVALVVECITEQLAPKQALFAELVQRAPAMAVLTSNSSGIPITAIAGDLPT
ncbi:MAG: NAD-binding protein, partial [Burkholderiaceae bacterium]|nr:NAD-binding protein [Burkholderiaceae bacterium]